MPEGLAIFLAGALLMIGCLCILYGSIERVRGALITGIILLQPGIGLSIWGGIVMNKESSPAATFTYDIETITFADGTKIQYAADGVSRWPISQAGVTSFLPEGWKISKTVWNNWVYGLYCQDRQSVTYYLVLPKDSSQQNKKEGK